MDKNKHGKDNFHWTADTYSNIGGLNVFSKEDTKRIINVTNNKTFYYSKLAKKYKDEAKSYAEDAKFQAEQNSNLTQEQLLELKRVLEQKISAKQDAGEYLLAADLPENVSAFTNDENYVTESVLTDAIDSVKLPEQSNKAGKFLQTDGENAKWVEICQDKLFDLKILDRVLSYEESKGLALQGTYVYKTAIAGSRYGYPDFYAKCLEEMEAGTEKEVTLGENTVTMYVNANGHSFYNISDKDSIDAWYNTYGIADFYGVDEVNERIFLPRNKWFMQLCVDTSDVNKMNKAGLPDHRHSFEHGKRAASGSNDYPYADFERTGIFNYTEYASNSNPIYGNSNTVQPPSSNKLLYYVVGNTKQDTSWINVVEQVGNGVLDIDNELNVALTQLQTKKTEAINQVGLAGTAGKVSIFEKGSEQDNEDVYANVYDLNRSTFGLSKFTVVGSPNIKADGVVSGFSNTNYLKMNSVIDLKSNCELNIGFTTADDVTAEQQILVNDSGRHLVIKLQNEHMITAIGNGTTWATNITGTNSIQPNTYYLYKLKFNGQKYTIYLNGAIDGEANITQVIPSHTSKLGSAGTASIWFKGSIDLKYFSITVDRKPVFSGNKTGIDTVKPDNYTVVGEPVISADGIASGFSIENYIKTSTISRLNNFTQVLKIKTPNATPTATEGLWVEETNTTYRSRMGLTTTMKLNMFLTSNGLNWDIGEKTENSKTLSLNTEYIIKLVYNGSAYKVYLSEDNGITYVELTNLSMTSTAKLRNLPIRLGQYLNSSPFNGSIDLNSFKIYTDGNLVYQPCLKIPYTESKTGSKIVDAAYRDRVQDVYEQFGAAMYYTIDEGNKDFTLPMGEIYRMIEQKSSINSYIIYETNWFDIATSGLYSFDLSGEPILNIDKSKLDVQMIGKVKTAQSGYAVGDIIYPQFANYDGSTGAKEIGSTIYFSGSVMNIRFGNDSAFVNSSPDGAVNQINKNNVEIKIILKGWNL